MSKSKIMKNQILIPILLFIMLYNCKNTTEKVVEVASKSAAELHDSTAPDSVNIIPIEHASFILSLKDIIIYVDPVGNKDQYKTFERPDYVLITDIHSDHFDPETLKNFNLDSTTVIAPKVVAEKLDKAMVKNLVIMNNGEKKTFDNMEIEAIPMYNLREEALKYHVKGRGNGYVLNIDRKRIYISGDTEDIPEMRQLQDIDIAFICMNLPYTMPVEQAADAVLEFKPKKVYPYHYRGTEGLSDIDMFKKLVNDKNPDIEVVELTWYP